MSLVLLSGQPLSGKTTYCNELIGKFTQLDKDVIHISLESLSLTPELAYKTSVQQKNFRSGLRSAVERALSNRDSVVLVDALNNIKGFRYELWCLARAVSAKYCLLYIETSQQICQIRNQEQELYSVELFEDLWNSFETPDSRNRWECPLFTISEGKEEGVLDRVVNIICGKTLDTGSLTPTIATSNPVLSDTNLQHNIDKATQVRSCFGAVLICVQSVLDRVIALQKEAGSEAIGVVSFGLGLPELRLDRYVTLIELRRLKRGFLKVATQGFNAKLKDSKSAQELFIEYLGQNL